MWMFAFKFEVRMKKCPCKNKTVQQTKLFQLTNRSKCCPLARTHALSLGRHWLMALSTTLCLNSAQTETDRCCFCKIVWRRYLGEVGKFLSYFVANLSRTLRINFYQNRSSVLLSIVEVMTTKFWCVFYASQCTQGFMYCDVTWCSFQLVSTILWPRNLLTN